MKWLIGSVLAGALASVAAFAAISIATVNGKTITEKDLMGALTGLNEGQKANVMKDPNSRKQVLSNVIDQEVLVTEAEKEKLDQDQEYKDALANFRKQYLTSKVLQKNLANKVTDSTAKKYYEAHKSRYSSDLVHAQHILVSDEQQAREIMKKAKEPNADFQELAEKNSKDPSVKNNRGDLGFFGRDKMVPEFTEPAFEAKEGQIIGPIKTQYGYHIIKVIEKKIGKPLDYAEVEYRVRSDLRNEIAQNYVNQLRSQAKVQVDEKALDKL
jgi:peptidyl-prolyl cis-trans isomerase C